MLLIIAAAALLALGLQLRARPSPVPAGYYLGADGVICMTAWKVVERVPAGHAPARPQPVRSTDPSIGPWGAFVRPGDEHLTAARPEAPKALAAPRAAPAQLPAPIRFEAADLAACLRGDPVRPAQAIIVPADVLAELQEALPRSGSARSSALASAWPSAPAASWREPPLAPAPETLFRTPVQSIALH